MDLVYKGVNGRGRAEWLDKDLTYPWQPEGALMEEWQMLRYRELVGTTEQSIGRQLTKDEAKLLCWLAGLDASTVDGIQTLLEEAYKHGASKV